MNRFKRGERLRQNGPDRRDGLQVLARDGFTCQLCGNRRELDAHHIRFRSPGGDDSLKNLLTLFRKCHAQVHASRNR